VSAVVFVPADVPHHHLASASASAAAAAITASAAVSSLRLSWYCFLMSLNLSYTRPRRSALEIAMMIAAATGR
jgi:hypothetical protein